MSNQVCSSGVGVMVVGWVLRPAFALATLVLVIAINAFVLLKNDNSSTEATAETDSMTSIAAEYNLNDNGALYEINQER